MKTTSTFMACLLALNSGFAAQPWNDEPSRQEQLRDPGKVDRPVTNTLKGEEIKEFRDQLNGVKAQIFKDGNVPAGAAFRSNDSGPNAPMQAEARFEQFTSAVQSQITARLPNAATSDQRILVEIPSGAAGESLKISSAKFTDAKTTLVTEAKPTDVPSALVPGLAVPVLPPIEKPKVTSLRQATAAPTEAQKDAVAVVSQEPSAAGVQSAVPTAMPVIRSEGRSFPQPTAVVEYTRPHIADVARVFSGDKGQMRVESRNVPATPAVMPVAVLALPEGGELAVESVTQTLSADIQLDIRANTSQLPEILETEIAADLPGALNEISAQQEIKLVVALKPDNSIQVVSLAPEESAAPVPSANVEDKGIRTQEPDALLTRTRELAPALSLSPAAVSIESRVSTSEAVPQAVSTAFYALEQGGTVIIKEIPVSKSEPSRFTADAKIRDLSPAMQEKVKQTLAAYGADKAVLDTSQVTVEVKTSDAKTYEVSSVVLNDPTAPEDEKHLTLWESSEILVETESNENRPMVVSRPVVRGLAPVVARLATEALGFEKGNFEIRDPDPRGRVRIQSIGGAQRMASVGFKRPAPSRSLKGGLYEFSVSGRPLDFSDSIREQIYAQLKESVERGDIWAKAAVDGLKDLVIQMDVPEEGAKADSIRVKSIAPATKDLAQLAALDMGLASGDYLIVNAGTQTLLVLEKNVTARLKLGEKEAKILSPDGDAKIFLKPDRAAKDSSVTLLLSRKSLKSNRDHISKAVGSSAGKAVDAALKNHPDEQQFVVRLDSTAEEPALIKPMTELTPNNSIMERP